jgi:hypothetical protein
VVDETPVAAEGEEGAAEGEGGAAEGEGGAAEGGDDKAADDGGDKKD